MLSSWRVCLCIDWLMNYLSVWLRVSEVSTYVCLCVWLCVSVFLLCCNLRVNTSTTREQVVRERESEKGAICYFGLSRLNNIWEETRPCMCMYGAFIRLCVCQEFFPFCLPACVDLFVGLFLNVMFVSCFLICLRVYFECINNVCVCVCVCARM